MSFNIQQLTTQVISIFLPENCLICKYSLSGEEHIIHNSCLTEMPNLEDSLLEILKSEVKDACFDKIYVPLEFSDSFQILIHYLKYRGFSKVAGIFGSILAKCIHYPDYDLITGVPLHPARERERGYNQSNLIAHSFAQLTCMVYDGRILKRNKNNVSQTSLDRNKREKNVAGIFSCSSTLDQKKILLIDDVITTGSTMNACCQALKENGALTVDIAALATPADILIKRI